MSRPGIEPGPPVGSEHSGKEPSRQLICRLPYSEPLHPGLYMAPPSACADLDSTGRGRIALASPRATALRALMQVRVIQITSGSLEKSHVDNLFAGYSETLLGLRPALHPGLYNMNFIT